MLVFGLGRGVASLAGEEDERTLDLLLAQPVERWSMYLQKAATIAGLWRWYLHSEPLATGFRWGDFGVLASVCVVSAGIGVLALSRCDLHG